MPLFSFEGKSPRIHPSAFIAPTAVIIGDVTIEENASVWYNAVIRSDFSPIVIRAGANVSVANREGVRPLQLAAMNGNAAMIDRLLKAGADANGPLTQHGDTALMMAARTGKTDALTVLMEGGAKVNEKEKWGGTSALMNPIRRCGATPLGI